MLYENGGDLPISLPATRIDLPSLVRKENVWQLRVQEDGKL